MAPAITPRPLRDMNTIVLRDGREIQIEHIATAAEAETLLDDLTGTIIDMEAQLEGIRTLSLPHDPDWLRRFNVALGRKRYQRPKLQRRLDELRKAERAAQFPPGATNRKDAMRIAFINAAKDILAPGDVERIWVRAKEQCRAAFNDGARLPGGSAEGGQP